jgi:hypothetical protein
LQTADSDAAKEFLKVADGVDDFPFAIVLDKALVKDQNVDADEAVIVFKKVCLSFIFPLSIHNKINIMKYYSSTTALRR